jgi:hypothetical protein
VAILSNLAEAEVAILADPDADEGQVNEIVERAEAEFVEEEPTSAPPAEETETELDEAPAAEAVAEEAEQA